MRRLISALEILRIVCQVLKETHPIDIAEQIQEPREEMLNLREENQTFGEGSTQLHLQLKLKFQIVYARSVFWIISDESTPEIVDVPVCHTCWRLINAVNRLPVRESTTGSCIACRKPRHGVSSLDGGSGSQELIYQNIRSETHLSSCKSLVTVYVSSTTG